MFHFVNKIIIQVVFILIILNNILYAGSIKYEFRFIKLLEYSKRDIFEPTSVENTDSDITVEKNYKKNTSYPFFIKVDNNDTGKKIKIKLNNESDWIVISNGEFVIPKISFEKNIVKNIDIKLIRKFSELYFDIFVEYEYSVQVFSIKNNKDKAKELVKNLQKDDKNIYHEGIDVYDEVVPIVPNKGYIYKVKVGRYSTLKEARLRLSKIKNRYSKLQDCFISVRSK